MNLKLSEFYERPDKAMGGKIMVFQFEDESQKIYRAEIPEGSDFYKKWYSVALGFRTASKQNQELWLSGVSVKPGTVEIQEDSDFKITTIEKNTAFKYVSIDETGRYPDQKIKPRKDLDV